MSLHHPFVAALLAAAPLSPQDPEPARNQPSTLESSVVALRAALEEPNPNERARHVERMAGSDVPLEIWKEAIAEVSRPVKPERTGSWSEEWSLWDGAQVVQTWVHLYAPRNVPDSGLMPLVVGGGNNGSAVIGHHQGTSEEIGMMIVGVDPTEELFAFGGYGFTEAERQLQLSALREAKRRFPIDSNRVFHSGHSRGGHLTWDVGLRNPDQFAGLLPMTGGPRLTVQRGQNNMRLLENVAHISVRDLQGSLDDPLLLYNLRLSFEKLRDLGARDAQLIEFPHLGHVWSWEGVDWPQWFSETQREPLPVNVVRLTDRPGAARSFWLQIDSVNSRKVKASFKISVAASRWQTMDDNARRRYVASAAEERTARLSGRFVEPGQFEVEGEHVRSFSLLLSEEMLGQEEKIRVRWNGRRKARSIERDVRVLLGDFVERIDPTFLPVVQISVR